MKLQVVLSTATVAVAVSAGTAGAAPAPPINAGCGRSGMTHSAAEPTVSLASSALTLRYYGEVHGVVRGSQTAAVTVSMKQAGGRLVGGTTGHTYTCTVPNRSSVSLPLNIYGRTLVRRHGRLAVRLTLQLVNGSGVRNTVHLSGVIRRG